MWTCDGCVLKLHLKRHYFWLVCLTARAFPVKSCSQGFMGCSLHIDTCLFPGIRPPSDCWVKIMVLINISLSSKSWMELVYLTLSLMFPHACLFLPLGFSWKPPFFRSELKWDPDSQLHGRGLRSTWWTHVHARRSPAAAPLWFLQRKVNLGVRRPRRQGVTSDG